MVVAVTLATATATLAGKMIPAVITVILVIKVVVTMATNIVAMGMVIMAIPMPQSNALGLVKTNMQSYP